MKKADEFNNILDECLERVLTRGETVQQCLVAYPENAAELEPLLRTALVAREATAVNPDPAFKEIAGYQFQAALREMEPEKRRGSFGWQPRWVTTLIVVIALLLAGSGTVAAANDSMPDEALYPVKLATETVRLAFTPSAMGKAELYVRLVDKRITEIIKMADNSKPEQVERATKRLNTQLIAMACLAAPGVRTAEDAEAVVLEAPPVIEEAPPVEERPALMIKVAPPRAPGPPEGVGSGEGGVQADKGGPPDKQGGLKGLLSQRAAENSRALQEELEIAPESVKPALRRAIEVAGAGYERVLSSLE